MTFSKFCKTILLSSIILVFYYNCITCEKMHNFFDREDCELKKKIIIVCLFLAFKCTNKIKIQNMSLAATLFELFICFGVLSSTRKF